MYTIVFQFLPGGKGGGIFARFVHTVCPAVADREKCGRYWNSGWRRNIFRTVFRNIGNFFLSKKQFREWKKEWKKVIAKTRNNRFFAKNMKIETILANPSIGIIFCGHTVNLGPGWLVLRGRIFQVFLCTTFSAFCTSAETFAKKCWHLKILTVPTEWLPLQSYSAGGEVKKRTDEGFLWYIFLAEVGSCFFLTRNIFLRSLKEDLLVFADFTSPEGWMHRRRIKIEEKANVVSAFWGTEFIQFLAALAILD